MLFFNFTFLRISQISGFVNDLDSSIKNHLSAFVFFYNKLSFLKINTL